MTDIATLHILNKSPDHPRATQCLASLASNDALLLTENGVLLMATSKLPEHARVLALGPDIQARGLAGAPANAKPIGFDDMVSLTLAAQRVISW